MKKLLIAIVLIGLVGAGIYVYSKKSVEISVATDYKNAAYEIEGVSVMLANGLSETDPPPPIRADRGASGSASKVVTRYFGNEQRGDLNGDGTEDIVFLLTQSSGGSGTFYYVAVALKTQNGYTGTNAVLLGDRVAPQTTEIRNSEIIVNYATRKDTEPMTAQPSVGVSKYLKVLEGRLVERDMRFGFIRAITTEGIVVVLFDDAKWLFGKDGEDAAIRAGTCTEKTRKDCLPNDYFIENISSTTIPLPLNAKVTIGMKTWNAGDKGILDQQISVNDFVVLINDSKVHWNKLPYNVTVENGNIVRIEEVYIP